MPRLPINYENAMLSYISCAVKILILLAYILDRLPTLEWKKHHIRKTVVKKQVNHIIITFIVLLENKVVNRLTANTTMRSLGIRRVHGENQSSKSVVYILTVSYFLF